MKLSIRIILVSLALTFSQAGAFAQGTVNFTNFAPPGVDAPFFGIDGTPMSGLYWSAILFAGPSADSLAPVGPSVPFEMGEWAGFFFGGERIIDSVPPGATAFVNVRVWQPATGASWEMAGCRGESSIFSVVTSSPGELPADLVGLQSINVLGGAFCIPEPGTFLLGFLALGIFLWRQFA